MNRHIIGFTLFLIIVKTAFLLNWLSFAPAVFFSTPEFSDEIATTQICFTEEANRAAQQDALEASAVKIESVSVNSRRNTVEARLNVKNFGEGWSSEPTNARLQIFDENSQIVWTGEAKLIIYSTLLCGNDFAMNSAPFAGDFKMFSNQLAKLDRTKNYSAQVQILSGTQTRHNQAVYQISDSQPVLLVRGKK